MTPEIWKLIASIGGVLITVVTAPMIWAIRAEAKAIRMQIDLTAAKLQTEITEAEKRLAEKVTDSEKRLNDRIDARLVRR